MTVTIHNLAYHGWTPRDRIGDLGLGADPPAGDAWGVDLLARGDRPRRHGQHREPATRARSLGPEMGMGLDGQLRARGDRFVGILNGLDQALWDPATDGAIAARTTSPTGAGRRPAERTSAPGSASIPPIRRRSSG